MRRVPDEKLTAKGSNRQGVTRRELLHTLGRAAAVFAVPAAAVLPAQASTAAPLPGRQRMGHRQGGPRNERLTAWAVWAQELGQRLRAEAGLTGRADEAALLALLAGLRVTVEPDSGRPFLLAAGGRYFLFAHPHADADARRRDLAWGLWARHYEAERPAGLYLPEWDPTPVERVVNPALLAALDGCPVPGGAA